MLLNPNYRWTEQREGAHTNKNVGRQTWPFTAAHYVASHNKSFMNKDNAAMHNTMTATVRVCVCVCNVNGIYSSEEEVDQRSLTFAIKIVTN